MGWLHKTTPPVEIQLPERDARILAKYEYRAKQFDEMIKICCCWIGYDVLLGMLAFYKITSFNSFHVPVTM